jgi:sulfate adenylyltransferase
MSSFNPCAVSVPTKLILRVLALMLGKPPGPRIRQILGRDHAGVGSYYGPFDAHRIFDEVPRGALAIEPMKIDWTFWCYKCGGMASGRTCPHDDADRLLVSGTKLRKWLSEGSAVPPEFSRPEVLDILRAYYASLEAHERVQVQPSGHSAR